MNIIHTWEKSSIKLSYCTCRGGISFNTAGSLSTALLWKSSRRSFLFPRTLNNIKKGTFYNTFNANHFFPKQELFLKSTEKVSRLFPFYTAGSISTAGSINTAGSISTVGSISTAGSFFTAVTLKSVILFVFDF